MNTQVRKWGHSLAVRIPKAFAREAKLAEGAEVNMTVSQGRLVIVARRPDYCLDQLVRQITPKNRHDEVEWGEPRGREAW